MQHPQPRGSPERATKLPPKSLFEARSIETITWARDESNLLCRDTKRGSPCKGWAKKILPVGWRFFLSQLAKPLQGAKSLLSKKQSEHRFPAYTLTIAWEHCIDAGTKRGNIGKAAERNEVLSRDHQAAENYEDSEDYYVWESSES